MLFNVPAALERSRSGNGGHIWTFFAEPVPAALERQIGAFLLSQTMERRPEIGLDSYNRFFPSEDTLPRGGFGNLDALPLQKKPRENGNSLFVNEQFDPYPDQWAFLASLHRMTQSETDSVVRRAEKQDEQLGIQLPVTDEDDDRPWAEPPSRKRADQPVVGPLPEQLDLVLGNQIYIPKADLTPSLRNRLISLAAFQNLEFYQAQGRRLSTFGKPRVISCCEDFPKHLGLPRGCLDELLSLLTSLNIKVNLADERCFGSRLDIQFHGALRAEQQAADALLQHEMGVLAASTAFGETVVTAYLIVQRQVNALVIVHRRQLLDQWVQALSKFLGLTSKEIGQIGGGKHKVNGQFDVAMVQSLSRDGVVDEIVGNYGYLVVDECHHISAVSFEQVVRQGKAKYITGLSATVTRKDGYHPIIFMQCGPVRHKVSDRSQAEKRPFDHRVIVRPTNFRLPSHLQNSTAQSIQEVYTLLANDGLRNRMIVDDVVAAVQAHLFRVLLTERREHLEVLAALLVNRVTHIFVMKGGMGKKQRRQGSQSITGLLAPMHALMLLSACDNQVIAFFNVGAADVLSLGTALPIVGNKRLALLQVLDQLVEFFDVLGLRAVFFEDVQSILHQAAPKVFEQQAEQLVLGFSSATDQADQVVAFLTAVIPIQNQSRHGPSCQTFLEETEDPAGAISPQKDFGLHIAATQQQKEQ